MLINFVTFFKLVADFLSRYACHVAIDGRCSINWSHRESQREAFVIRFEIFVAALSIELLNLAKMTDLLDIADHYALTSVKPFMLKH